MKEIYHNLKNPTRMFPYEFIITCLEDYNMLHPMNQAFLDCLRQSSPHQASSRSNPFWIASMMIDHLSFTFSEVYKVYKNFYLNLQTSLNKPQKSTYGSVLHSIKCLIALLELWIRAIDRNYTSISIKNDYDHSNSSFNLSTPIQDLRLHYEDIVELLLKARVSSMFFE